MLAALRASTAQLHRDVEALPSMTRLLGPLTLDGYVDALRRLRQFHTSQEARLCGVDLPPELRQRPNLALLERDLCGFPLEQPPERAPASWAEALGVLYVLEGSALGGTVIARHVGQWPELAGRTAFFGRPSGEVVARWRTFCRVLASYDEEALPFRRGVLAGARSAFLDAKHALGDD